MSVTFIFTYQIIGESDDWLYASLAIDFKLLMVAKKMSDSTVTRWKVTLNKMEWDKKGEMGQNVVS